MPTEFQETRALLERMEHQLKRFDRAGDHRAAFLRVYAAMTRRVLRRMEDGRFFLDPAWIERVAIRFAGMYFDALRAYDRRQRCPPAWQTAFDAAVQKRTFLLEDVVLGVNAHINNDLPQVLASILAEEGDWGDTGRMERRRYDHDQINRILSEIVETVEDEVAAHYGRLVHTLGRLMGRLDELLAAAGLKRFRDNTWRQGRFLLAAASEAERAEVRAWVEDDARWVAGQILRFGAPAWARPAAGIARRLRLF